MTNAAPVLPVLDITSAEHYWWGDGCEGWRLLTKPTLSIIQERVPPGKSEVLHFHLHTHQFFFVLSGIATMHYADQHIDVRAQQGVYIANRVAHRLVNNTANELVFLVVSTAPAAQDRIEIRGGEAIPID
jgi:mannose-6-phosphate isomerase-like protein (cupin superfamily)